MALTTKPAETGSALSKAATSRGNPGRGAPAWTAPLFFAGVALVFLGERVLLTMTTPRVLSTAIGVGSILVATAVRWASGARTKGERGRIENLLAIAQTVAVCGIAVALASSLFARQLGLDSLDNEARGLWDNAILVAWVTLLLCGLLPLLFAETALVPMRRAAQPESRRIHAAAAAGLTLALALAYLGLFVGAAHRWGVAADFAYFKTARPSVSTLKVAAGLKEPVKVVAFFPAVNEVRNEVDRYMRELARSSPKIKFEFIDRVLNPKVARDMRVAQDGAIVLSRGELRQVINLSTDFKSARTTLRNFDQEVQKNLMKLARDAKVAYLTTGHRELNDRVQGANDKDRGVTGLRKLLEMQNYRILDLGMPQGLANELPSDATVVMVLGPQEPFAPEELAALKRYVENGGALLLALDPDAVNDTAQRVPAPAKGDAQSDKGFPAKTADRGSSTSATTAAGVGSDASLGELLARGGSGPNLNALLALVGLGLDPSILVNDKGDSVSFAGNKSDRARIVTNRFGSHASVSTLSRHSAWVVLFGSGSLQKLDANDKRIDFALRTTTSTFQDKNGNFEAEPGEARASYDVAAAVTRKLSPGAASVAKDTKNDKLEHRSFVIADADLFSDMVLKNVPTNRLLLLDAVRWLGGEESLSGEVNSEEDVRIEHTKEKDVLWFYAIILGVPLLVLGLGLGWARRSRGQGGSR